MIAFESNPIITTDLELSLAVTPTDGARLIFTLRDCVSDDDPVLVADSDDGLLVSPEESVTAASAAITAAASSVAIWIRAEVIKLLETGAYAAELRELVATGTRTRTLAEGTLRFRHSAGREVA